MRKRWLILGLLICSPTVAVAASRSEVVYAVAKRAVGALEAKNLAGVRDATWPDGYHTIIRRDQNSKPLTRHWRNVPFNGTGVNFESRFGKPSLSIHRDRAYIRVGYTYRVEDFVHEKPQECGYGTYRFDLRRRQGEWRVLNLTDIVLRSSERC